VGRGGVGAEKGGSVGKEERKGRVLH